MKIRDNDKYKKSRLKIAVWHHPLLSSSEDRIKNWDFMEQLVRNNFRLILHGHIHQANLNDFHRHQELTEKQIDIIAAGTFGVPVGDLVPNYPLEYHLMNWKAKRLKVCSSRRLQPDAVWQKNFIFPPEPQLTLQFDHIDSTDKSSEEKSYCYEIEKVIPKQERQKIWRL